MVMTRREEFEARRAAKALVVVDFLDAPDEERDAMFAAHPWIAAMRGPKDRRLEMSYAISECIDRRNRRQDEASKEAAALRRAKAAALYAPETTEGA